MCWQALRHLLLSSRLLLLLVAPSVLLIAGKPCPVREAPCGLLHAQVLVVGSPVLDFAALERVAVYQGGYAPDSQAVRWFWEVRGGGGVGSGWEKDLDGVG